MKPPPFLLGAALLFWGWQTDFLLAGVIMGGVLEGARFLKARWEFSDEDLTRIWTFCSILFLAAIVYAFAANDGVSNFAGLFQDPSLNSQRRAGDSSSRTALSMIRWLPMVLFLFVAAQSFNTRTAVPLATISLIFRRRLKEAAGTQEPPPALTTRHVLFSYFAVCLCAASAHTVQAATFFTGFCALILWVLWPHRPRRFSVPLWAGVAGLVLLLGYGGQRGILQFQRLLNQYNPQWFARFSQRGFDPERTRTALGQIGELKTSGRIVIRLRTPEGQAPPDRLREASYRDYHSLSWTAGEAAGPFEYLSAGGDGTRWDLLAGAKPSASLNIACAIPGQRALLPLPRGTVGLEQLPDYVILSRNQNGAVLAEQAGLVIFDARYGNGPTIDAPPGTNTDRAVPEREQPALQAVIESLDLGRGTREDKLSAVQGLFARRFSYSLWQRHVPARGTNDTPLARFLLETRSGHCEYFATATVLLLRALDIPARYAVGYAVHEGSGNKYVVRQRDAHAWCLVWDEGTETWQDFDTTPGSWIAEEARRASLFQWLSDGWSRIQFEIAKVRWGQTNLRRYLLWALIPVLVFLLYRIVFRRRKRHPEASWTEGAASAAWPGLDSEFFRVERRLLELGLERRAGETVLRWMHRITESEGNDELRTRLRVLVRLHYRLRFDPLGLPDDDRAGLRRQARSCVKRLDHLTALRPGA